MNAQRFILGLIDGGAAEVDAFAAALADRDLPRFGAKWWLRDRIDFLYTTFVGLSRAEARRPSSFRTRTLFYQPSSTEARRRNGAAFVREHFGQDVDIVVTHQLKGDGSPRKMTPRERRLSRSWRRRARLAALATLLDPRGRYGWWGHVFAGINTFTQGVDQFDVVYFDIPWDRRTYALATFLARHTSAEVRIIFESMPLYGNQRRLHIPVTAVVTSKVNVPETAYFRATGEFKASEIIYRSGEYIEERATLTRTAPLYDIGFFASGDWARERGLYWARDVELVRKGVYRDNVYERYSMQILEALARYAHERGRTLRIYLHPYERRLLHEHGIEPPYRGLADGRLVTIDDAPGNSRGAHYEIDAAVALRSSSIWQRIDLGLDHSFIYAFDDPTLGNMLPESLGEFQRNVFHSIPDLFAKLDACFVEAETPVG